MRQKLTDLAIQRLVHPLEGDIKYWDTVLPGFGVRVTSRSKSFFVSFGAKRQMRVLGRYPAMTLKDARSAAKAFQTTPTSRQRPKTLQEAISEFKSDAQGRLSPRTVQNYEILLARLTHQRVDQVKREDATDAHALACYKIFFNWLIREGFADRNPFHGHKAVYGKRSRVLSDAELAVIWHYADAPFSDHLKLLMLTGQRRSQFSRYEVRDNTIWFPAGVMKGGQEHTIPLTPGCNDILDRLKSFNGWSKSKGRMDSKLKIAPWVIHDLRRTFSTNMARLKVPLHVTERILDHRSGTVSGVAAIYNRYDFLEEARESLGLYEAWLLRIVGTGRSGVCGPLRRSEENSTPQLTESNLPPAMI